MTELTFLREAAKVQEVVAATPLREFAVPHLIVDDILPDELVAQINENWPEYTEGFFAEVPGNHILQLYRRDYGRMAESRLRFWRAFNETLWPAIASAAAEALAGPALEVFGGLYREHLSLDMPLTLMQADPTYPGHWMHTHFYHCPHWAFTMLLYIDPEDTHSQGTALHRLLPRGEPDEALTSYLTEDLDWRVEVAMETFHWKDPNRPDRLYYEKVADYKANRLFVFQDGPLALHSVPFDNPDHTPNPARADDGGRHARRRILRSHVKVHHDPFYEKHSALLRERLEPERYMRLMAPNPVLSAEDERYRNVVIRPFYKERLEAYARAAKRAQDKNRRARPRKLWDRVIGRPQAARGKFMAQLVERIP